MKIGIIVHSHTGNTYSVAEKLQKKLLAGGHTVDLRKIEPIGGENTNEVDASKIKFDPAPSIAGYASVIICGPVRGFSMSPVLSAYLQKISSLKDTKIDLFVTQHFPYAWMGGNNAIAQMKKRCVEKGATITNTGIVNWKSKKREAMIEELVSRLGNK